MRSASVRSAPPGNLSEIDFGIDTDRDRSLAMALPYFASGALHAL